jgi:predicted esterase
MQKIESVIFNESATPEWIYVYLHGSGGFPGSGESLYKYRDFPKLLKIGELKPSHPFVVLHALEGEHWDAESVDSFLLELKATYHNPKIHLIGYSRGGFGVYEYISKFKGASRATVINSRVFSDLDTETALDVFHAKKDQITPIESVKALVKQKIEQGQPILFHEYEGDHYSVETVALSGIVA